MTSQDSSTSRAGDSVTPSVSIAELDANAHSIFRRYRPETALLRRSDGALMVIRARDVERLMTDPRTRQGETELLKAQRIDSGPIYDVWSNSLLFSNDKTHRRRRAPMSRVFAFRMIAELRPRIRAVADSLIEAHLQHGRMNLVDEYAALIPARTIAAILGLPQEDIPDLTRAVYTFVKSLSAALTHEDLPSVTEAGHQLLQYAERSVAQRREKPGNDFLTAFVQEVDRDNEMTAAEVLSQLVSVIIGGSDTTRGQITILTSLLLEHREQWDAICKDSGLIPGAVAEALRYEPIGGTLSRFTLADIELGDQIAPAGSFLSLSLMSALRDPELYSDPDNFDIRRSDHPRWHLAFGGGAHRCLGEALAKAEMEEGLAALAARLPRLNIEGDPVTVTGHSGVRLVSPLAVVWPNAN